MDLVSLTIDGVQVQVPAGTTVLEAARLANIQIPTLCYLKDVNQIGACRMCLVDTGARAFAAACVMPVSPNMVVKTNTPAIREARKVNMELLLSNHDRKCLTCVRSRNCELQTLAEELGVRVAIENCPMLFTEDEWPGGQNLMTSPANWRKVFEILPHENLGINYDPSHFIWQQIDYIKPIYEFRDKIFHVHYKDIKLYPEKLADVGTMATPLEYMSPKLPGLGDVDWGRYVSALTDIGYQGDTCIEIEDKAFEGSVDQAKRAVRLSARHLRNFVI